VFGWKTRRSAKEVAKAEDTLSRLDQGPGRIGSTSGFWRLVVTVPWLLLGMALFAYGRAEREGAAAEALELHYG
jgi:hypothetical protein